MCNEKDEFTVHSVFFETLKLKKALHQCSHSGWEKELTNSISYSLFGMYLMRHHYSNRTCIIQIVTHRTKLHCTALHYTTQHNTTIHCTALNYTSIHYTSRYCNTIHYTTPHYTTQHHTTLHYTTLHYTTQHNTTQHKTTLQTALQYTTVH